MYTEQKEMAKGIEQKLRDVSVAIADLRRSLGDDHSLASHVEDVESSVGNARFEIGYLTDRYNMARCVRP